VRGVQLALDGAGAVRATDPQTSRDAARAVTKGVEHSVLQVFNAETRLTDDELVERMPNLHGPTCKSARSRLSKRGVLVDSGERRPSVRGQPMIVWRKTNAALSGGAADILTNTTGHHSNGSG
jgi:hypothetical protein